MIYFNQNNYANIPYPSSESPKATIKTGGCGPTCGAMIVSNLTGKTVDPPAMAQYAISKGARVSGGTEMNVLAKAISADYGLMIDVTSDELALITHLKAGGWAIANVGGDRRGYTGVFSNGGHYIVVSGLTPAGKVIVLDPGYYVGKFNKAGRVGKVRVNGNYCICDISVLAKDTESRSPSYWLFSKSKGVSEVPQWMKDIMANAAKAGLITGEHNPAEPATKWFVLGVALNLLKIIKGGK